ncbi:hypothetical protein [Ideonella sp. A 288]
MGIDEAIAHHQQHQRREGEAADAHGHREREQAGQRNGGCRR